MRKIYENPKWRAGISTVLTALVGICLALLGDWNAQQNNFWLKIGAFAVTSIIDLMYVIFCAAQDSKEHALISALKTENNVYKKAMSGIILVSQNNSSEINE